MTKILNRGLKVDHVDGVSQLTNKIYPQVDRKVASVTAKTADYTITVAELNNIVSNAGDTGTMVITLPAVRDSIGKCLAVHILAAQIVRLLPASGEIVNLNGSVVVTKYLNIAATIGNYCDVYCDGVQWIVTGYSGVVTKEA
jgi:hypothetical protein